MIDNVKKKIWYHPIDPVKKPFRKEVFGFDVETETEKNVFTLCAFVNDNESVICRTIQEVINFLDNHPKCVLCATNLGFDFYSVFSAIPENWEVLDKDGRLLSATYYPKGNRKDAIKCYDSISYVPHSVENLGKLVKIAKMDHPECFNTHPTSEKEWKELEDYCVNDALITFKFFTDYIIEYINKNKIKLSPTIAGLSMSIFQSQYLFDVIEIRPENQDFIRLGYYGGRCETFRAGKFDTSIHPVKCKDVNSMYAYIMSSKELPDPNTEQVMNKANIGIINKYEGFCYIEGFQKREGAYVPILPIRNPLDNDKLIFPTGFIKGVYHHAMIRKAVKELGFRIDVIGKSVYYLKTKPYLQQFAKEQYKLRLEQQKKGDSMQIMTKSVLTNHYGRYALNWKCKKSLIPCRQFLDKENKHLLKAIEYTYCNNTYYAIEEVCDTPPKFSIPVWAATITAYSQLYLWETLNKVQDNLISCDTDSAFTFGDVEIPTGDKLGDFKEEYVDGQSPTFIKPKVYLTEKSVKWKGFKFRDIKDKDGKVIKTRREQFIETMNADKRKEERFCKIKTAVKTKSHHKLSGIKVNERYWVTKKVNLEDTKRDWYGIKFDKNKVHQSQPIHLEEDTFTKKQRMSDKIMLKAYTERRYKELIASDEFDINAVGKDIDPMEYLNNEMSKEFF